MKDKLKDKAKDTVIIKSFPNGISLILPGGMPFDQVLEEVARKFWESKKFFGNARLALSIEGRKLTDAEELSVLEAITENSDLQIVCIVGHDEETEQIFTKSLYQAGNCSNGAEDGQFFRGSLKEGEVFETESNIVILGDVCLGSAVTSAKSIIVLGGLYGAAYAGESGQTDAYVVALEMAPEKLVIGDFRYKNGKKPSKWGVRPKIQPKIAYIKDKKIVFDTLTKELLSSI